MSIDFLRVPDATQSRFASDEARPPRVSGGEAGGKNAVEHKAIARFASPSSTVRLRFPGADAVLLIFDRIERSRLYGRLAELAERD